MMLPIASSSSSSCCLSSVLSSPQQLALPQIFAPRQSVSLRPSLRVQVKMARAEPVAMVVWVVTLTPTPVVRERVLQAVEPGMEEPGVEEAGEEVEEAEVVVVMVG